nr:Na+/H+ antiporter NhaA [Streptomyces sp. SID4948]
MLGRLPFPERSTVAEALRAETVGGVLLLLAAVSALVWANTAPHSYAAASDFPWGPSVLGLRLSVSHWAADGLLAVFFFVAGVELKRELVAGELREPAAAALPVIAALCGMATPAVVYTVVSHAGGGSLKGWAVPIATDIAFALAVLAVIGTALPAAVRAFLLTLAVVDDLFAILIIAIFFTSRIRYGPLLGAFAGLVIFWLLLRLAVRGWYVYLPLALVIWALMLNSGVHATIAGVAMGLMLRCTTRKGERRSPGERIEHLMRPLSAGLAVPLFALFSAGVPFSAAALSHVFEQPETLGVVLGLVVGKTVGVFGGTWLAARFTRARLSPELRWPDVLAVATLAGLGFTVSLLIGELAFTDDPLLVTGTKAAVLTGSLISALLAAILLRLRNNRYRTLAEEENRDGNGNGNRSEDDTAAGTAEHRGLAQLAGDDGEEPEP